MADSYRAGCIAQDHLCQDILKTKLLVVVRLLPPLCQAFQHCMSYEACYDIKQSVQYGSVHVNRMSMSQIGTE